LSKSLPETEGKSGKSSHRAKRPIAHDAEEKFERRDVRVRGYSGKTPAMEGEADAR
jgi:hypothetical protein